ncbi:hypothetical protein HGM15179_002390 [Zosterops borbonicus]|uniref:Uncharacterized protein n=1 Tax=Zosterops borbonicus TaxID=364589 RepID=A0A8K1GUP4_9PASS|nr:hypothetical protein HGM15179_002390 [Zosterops borbonicus]
MNDHDVESPCASKSDQQSLLFLAIVSTLQEASFIIAKPSKQQVPILLWPPSDEGHHCGKTMLDAEWCPYPILSVVVQKFQWDTKAIFGLASALAQQKSKADGAEVPMSTPYPYGVWFGLDLVWLP